MAQATAEPETGEPETGEPEAGEPAGAPIVMPIFQAADPVAVTGRRRRAASRPAGPPQAPDGDPAVPAADAPAEPEAEA